MTEAKVVHSPAEYMDSFDAACPQQAYRDLAVASPFTAPDGMPLVTRMAELIALNRHPAVHATDGVHFNLGSKRPLIPLDLDGAEHTRFRKLLDPLFSPKSVARLADEVRELTNALIDDFAGTGEVELFEAFCVPLPSQIFIRLLGLPMSDLPRFVAFKDATVRPEGATQEERDAHTARAGATMYAYLQDVLEQRRREPPRDDLIGGFLTTEVDGDRLVRRADHRHLLPAGHRRARHRHVVHLVPGRLAGAAPRGAGPAGAGPVAAAGGDRGADALRVARAPRTPVGRRGHRDRGPTVGGGTKVMVVWASANLDPDAVSDPLTVDSGADRALATSASPAASTAAWARTWPGSSCGSPWRSCIAASPTTGITPGAEPVYINYGVRAAIQLPLSFTPHVRQREQYVAT